MPYADLHVHTTRSDGHLELEAVPEIARRNGLEVVAITDHDRRQPFERPIVKRDGVTLIHGIELRVEIADGHRVDLLGYGLEPTDPLESLLSDIQTNRRERGKEIVERVEEELGVDLDVIVGDGFGRPHVARAIAEHPEIGYDYADAFDELIGYGDPCFVPRDVPSFERGRQFLADAAELVSLAHPLRYRDPHRALERAKPLDAIEVHYPYGRAVDLTPVERVVDRYDLRVTGGSDAHDDALGTTGVSKREYQQLGLSV